MSDNKICFIICSNDNDLASECLLYIEQLRVPEGFEIETMVVCDAPSMCAGYNEAMSASDAKYKIYLHQDVLLVYRGIIESVVSLFEKHPEVGMIGLVGSTSLADDGCQWSDGIHRRIGEILSDLIDDTVYSMFGKVNGEYQPVVAIDGLFMATQYDITWREDLFGGWDLYDASQALEFWKAGYKVVVPYMNKPWCLHDNDIVNLEDYEKWRNVFVQEYQGLFQKMNEEAFGEPFPFVSVIIPTCNRAHTIKRAIDSVLNQTYKNIELIIVDDCSTDDTKRLVEEWYGNDNRITYIVNEVKAGAGGAGNIGAKAARGEWIAFNYSNDEWHLDKLEKQVALIRNVSSRVGMVYSQIRWNYDNGVKAVWPPDDLDMKYKSGDIFSHVLISPLCGAPAMLIRKQYFEEVGGFDVSLHSFEDYEFSIRFAKEYMVLLCDEPLVEVYESANSVGKQNDEKIRVQCLIMDNYSEDLKRFGYRELKMKTVWKEAEGYGNVHILEENVKLFEDDKVFSRVFQQLKELRE